MMNATQIEGYKIFKDRHGKLRCYHRATGTAIDLTTAPLGSPEFIADCKRIAAGRAVKPPTGGTLAKLIEDYRKHDSFKTLAIQTQSDYQKVFNYLKPIGDTPLIRFDKALVVRIRDKATSKGRRFANYVKAVLSIIFGWGSERGYMSLNAASGIKDIRRNKNIPEANRAWTDSERHAALAVMPPQMLPAFALMTFTALGPKDALELPKPFYKDGEIATRRAKTGEPVFWQAPRDLVAILDNAPKHDSFTLCANLGGLPWTLGGFRASWRKVRIKLEQDGLVGLGLTLYGLRHTVAVILREIEYDERTIADALGQKTIEMARHYAKGADLKPKMRGVVDRLDEELLKRRTKSGK
ncbi:integrase [Beijerinckia sp. L45]|uniref:tyrosine-type recombinase/integrase n=1 Tax=Beijerinckia sp. L45 TaxID=1641855 RepID=UPI001FED6879|nr:integrase [Beijerinckia sp. L45]